MLFCSLVSFHHTLAFPPVAAAYLFLVSCMRALTYIAIALAVFIGATAGAAPRTPSDLHIVAHFGSGHIPVLPDDPANGAIGAWYVRVDARGVAKIEVIRHAPGKKTEISVRYSKQELEQITDIIEKARFFDLPRYLDGGITDVPGYTLEIRMHGKTHSVSAIAPGAFRNKKLLKRFTSVWAAVCHKMPSKLDDGATLDLLDRS
jgi:hypothetical protein